LSEPVAVFAPYQYQSSYDICGIFSGTPVVDGGSIDLDANGIPIYLKLTIGKITHMTTFILSEM